MNTNKNGRKQKLLEQWMGAKQSELRKSMCKHKEQRKWSYTGIEPNHRRIQTSAGDFQKGNSKFANMNGNKIMIERQKMDG
jgi:hypothetical protein